MKNGKDNFNRYQELMREKFDLEDRVKKNNHRKWELNCENVQLGRQKTLVEHQLRNLLGRKIIEFEDNGNGNKTT